MSLSGYLSISESYQDYVNNIEYKQEDWENYLSEIGMKKFTVAQIKSFTLSIDSLNSKLRTANGVIKF
jgi:DNA-directed RNA polymerase subunit N (RpoN/RPB10)